MRRLEKVFDTSRAPLFFLTICVRDRTPALADAAASEILVCAWREALPMYGWKVGRYVVMPDHVHFFGAPASESAKNLSTFVGGWKRWTQRRIRDTVLASFAWQAEFFDHVMRGAESYEQKWEYVRANPVRAGLVARPQDWSNQGEVHVLCW